MTTTNLNAYRDLTLEEIRTALTYLDAGCGREEWVRVAMALKAELGHEGYPLFDEWSATASSYDKSAARDTWKSLKKGGGVTIATLIYEAKNAGFELDEKKRNPLSVEQIAERRARQEAEAEEDAAERKASREAAAAEAQAIWEGLQPVEGKAHPYLARKNVDAFGLRVGKWKNYTDDALFVPIRNHEGTLVSLQAILSKVNDFTGRDRDYLKGGEKAGCFHMIGGKPSGNSPLFIASGYSTAATVHRCSGHPTVVAFDDSNLPRVARVMRDLYPEAQIVIAGDDDKFHKAKDGKKAAINSGVHYSRQAATTVGGVAVFPKFEDTSSEPTDFNDLQQLEGFDVVREQLARAIPKQTEDDFVPLDMGVNPFMFPHLSNQNKPLNTWENLAWMLEQYGIQIRYNVIGKDLDVTIPGRQYGFDSRSNCVLAELTSLCARNQMPKADLADYMKLIGDRNRFNPVQDFIKATPWDGRSRLQDLYATIKTASDFPRDLVEMFIRRWLISAVAAAFKETDFWSKGVLVLQGGQSKGKTSWIRSLLPQGQEDLFKEGALIDPSQKDTVSSAISHWLVELGELDATFRKADVARLKSFISNKVDMLRRPYDRNESRYQRRTVFFASVNPKHFLSDDTGNVRWWTIPVEEIDYEHGIDVQQLWAEVATLYEDGERWWHLPEEEARLEEINGEHTSVDPIEELIRTHFNWASPMRGKPMTATGVLLELGFDKPTKTQSTQMRIVLEKIAGKPPRKSNGSMVFDMPPGINERPF